MGAETAGNQPVSPPATGVRCCAPCHQGNGRCQTHPIAPPPPDVFPYGMQMSHGGCYFLGTRAASSSVRPGAESRSAFSLQSVPRQLDESREGPRTSRCPPPCSEFHSETQCPAVTSPLICSAQRRFFAPDVLPLPLPFAGRTSGCFKAPGRPRPLPTGVSTALLIQLTAAAERSSQKIPGRRS